MRDFVFTLDTVRFDDSYVPADGTRLTTNFANLARGAQRQQNLRNVMRMIDNRFNTLAHWDNPESDRYSVALDIVTVNMAVADEAESFPLIEVLQTTIIDHKTGQQRAGIVGNNFSSYVRDYDFSVLLRAHLAGGASGAPAGFGDLHGNLFKSLVASDVFTARFAAPPVICISVSESKAYQRTANTHPVLGAEYSTEGWSLTDQYFQKMGLQARYFMPPGSVAPFAFYCAGDLLNDYTPLQLIGTIATMETFQKIYRPEIYNANSAAGQHFKPSLKNEDYAPTRIFYDREERTRLGIAQGQFTQQHFIAPYGAVLDQWSAQYAR
ncbi:hypothetical protein BVG79_p1000161 (plasmid) [Ketogulonicigenium robustum]|uniref:DUF1852 domain-containing protein n=1 Tax=Ketogulonicigenium robustum TaxID=92947 RepID=A0A1W6P3H6_9RHOB|nr:putative oxygenase MesX [Ketogulonicigenium robustum]ARO15963.1 hypothetical protein BVG79_p1000161 [Ketogulonicigenium robustum]